MISAFGVDHGDDVVSKADSPQQRRYNRIRHTGAAGLGALDPGGTLSAVHGAVSAKKGKRARAAANQGFGTAAGSTLGGLGAGFTAAALTRNPAAARGATVLGGVSGGAYGSYRGSKRNARKGYLKGVTN